MLNPKTLRHYWLSSIGSRWQKPSITARYRWSRSVPWFYAWQLLARPCGLSFPGAELNCGDQYYWTIPAILSPSTPGFKSCSASRLSRFYSKSWMVRLVNRLQRCKSTYSSGRFWKLSSKTQFPIEVSLNQSLQLFTISFRFDNFGCLYYYHKDRDRCPPPLPSMWLKEKEPWKKMKPLMKLKCIMCRY